MYLAWRSWHPASRSGCPKAHQPLVRRAVEDYGAETVALVIEWAHVSPDPRARYLRGEEGAGPFLGLDNLLTAKPMPGRVEMASAWAARGKPDRDQETVKPAARGRDQGQGWIEETSHTLEWARAQDARRKHAVG